MTKENLRWSLEHNYKPELSQAAINGIILCVEKVSNGEMFLEDNVIGISDVTIGELLNELNIDIDEFAFQN